MVLQTEAAECGLACLSMVAGYHGDGSDPTALRRRFGFSLIGLDVNTADEQVLGVDLAPDSGDYWRYTLVNRAAVRLVFTKVVTNPARPRAGKSFTVGIAATRYSRTPLRR